MSLFECKTETNLFAVLLCVQEPPPIPPNNFKLHSSPFMAGRQTQSTNRIPPRPLPKPSEISAQPTRLASETFGSVTANSFYGSGSANGSATSKYFPQPIRDAANPASFFTRTNVYQAPDVPSEPDSPPVAKRMPDLPRHVVTQKRPHPAAENNEPIDLVSESEEEETEVPVAGPSRLANSQNGFAAGHDHPASSGQMTSSSHARHSSPPPHRGAKPQHRHQESRSSSTEAQLEGQTNHGDDPIEEYDDEKGKQRARMDPPMPSERPQPKQVRARMQDRNGVVHVVSNSLTSAETIKHPRKADADAFRFQPTEVHRNPRQEPFKSKSIGQVVEYHVNGKDYLTGISSLSLRNDGLVYGKKSFAFSRMTCLLVRIYNGRERVFPLNPLTLTAARSFRSTGTI